MVAHIHSVLHQQVLGLDLKTPSKFLICWTPEGKEKGGTATAIKLAIINNRAAKIFKDPNISFFIILCLILVISCYSFIASPIKNGISNIVVRMVIH